MPKLTVDGIEIEVPDGSTVLQACEAAGAEVPRFCYHERLSIAGNCRMCLVEMEKAPKPVASCAMPAGDGMVVHTRSETARKARNGVMEFLLINHPLDCPICDQGGECDLQDQAMAYGRAFSRYDESKRAVTDKDLGPLVKTIMTRCIHCTRCIRFATEIAGVEELGATSRGEHMEITTYVEKSLSSELSGNVIDLCPVGALTSKPYAFTARSWELNKTPSIDVFDAVGSNIRIDARGSEVMRVLPRTNDDINEEWISDKTRFACDGLKYQRLDRPYVRRAGRLQEATWDEAFAAIGEALGNVESAEIAAIAGDLCDAESMFALKELMGSLGTPNIDCRLHGERIDAGVRGSYLFNTTIAGIEEADACLIIGSNPRWEAPLVNARLRKRWLEGGFKAGNIGPAVDLTFGIDQLGAGTQTLKEIADGSHAFCKVLEKAKRPMLILGTGAIDWDGGAQVMGLARAIADKYGLVSDGWNGYNVLHRAAGRVGGLDLGFVPGKGGRNMLEILDGAAAGDIKFVWLLGADELDGTLLHNTFVVYQGHHGDTGAHTADVVLPGAAYTEKNATYVNMEGRVQRGRLAVFPPGDAREDWTIIRAFSEKIGKTLPYNSLEQLRARLADMHPTFSVLNEIQPAEWKTFGKSGKVEDVAFVHPVENFYMTDPISRASRTMAQCTETYVGTAPGMTGTDG